MKKEVSGIFFFSILAIIVGCVLAYIDTLPKWDDTGVIAIAVLLLSAAFAFLHPRYAWLWALLIGLPVALLNILTSKNYGSLAVFLFSFAGAYTAFLTHKLVQS